MSTQIVERPTSAPFKEEEWGVLVPFDAYGMMACFKFGSLCAAAFGIADALTVFQTKHPSVWAKVHEVKTMSLEEALEVVRAQRVCTRLAVVYSWSPCIVEVYEA